MIYVFGVKKGNLLMCLGHLELTFYLLPESKDKLSVIGIKLGPYRAEWILMIPIAHFQLARG